MSRPDRQAASAAYTKGDRVRFWEEAPNGDELTFEGVVTEVVAGNGVVRLLIDTPLGRRLRTEDEVEPARRGRRA